jgi:hypothetical protein
MKTANGNIVRYFEALKDDKVALTINGDGNHQPYRSAGARLKRSGVKIGTRLASCTAKPLVTVRKAQAIMAPWWSARRTAVSISAMPLPATGMRSGRADAFRRHAEKLEISKIIWRANLI